MNPQVWQPTTEEQKAVECWLWILRQADGRHMRFTYRATMFFRHPGHDAAR